MNEQELSDTTKNAITTAYDNLYIKYGSGERSYGPSRIEKELVAIESFLSNIIQELDRQDLLMSSMESIKKDFPDLINHTDKANKHEEMKDELFKDLHKYRLIMNNIINGIDPFTGDKK